MIIRKIKADCWDSGNSLTMFCEIVCECERCGCTYTTYDDYGSNYALCPDCEEEQYKRQEEEEEQ